ncbi:sphingomyelin phosphodiesterase [Thalassomonas viridans]|uniref:Sphingomyelin phosphodiesterase n=1 Tax=Thalassomonas viridans TaxID=137584 RepID=A0AAF0C6G6_9GAMM|nr:sphingomyelin phosphodiesterase [Thalassomonas viridans]WDE04317.1 sphingomyelin phosphodiesterase [Thalassomonas viridans]
MQQYLFKLIAGFSLLLVSLASGAESYIYLTNNTEQELTLEISQYGGSLNKGEHWKQHASKVPPLATVRFLEMNRDTGITWGEDFYFDTLVTSEDGNSTVLRQKLTGTWNFSSIWHGMDDSPWYDDRNIHTITRNFIDADTSIAVKAESARINGDDFYYVIHPKPQYPSVGDSNNFKVLAYNVWALLPGIVSKSVSERLNLLTKELDGYDAIVFSELFDNNRRSDFLNGIKDEYPYQTKVVDRSGALEDGGVLIVSRWPIEAEDQITYNDCDADDCIAAKGVIYGKINKQGNIYHLFGSHTQAWPAPENQNTRANQFQQMSDFITGMDISSDEPVIIAGDLNVDKANFEQEYINMLNILQAEEVSRNGGYLYTADGNVNYWTSGTPEILDYVLYSTRHLRPLEAEARVVTPRSIHKDVFTQYDLSDHFAVKGELTF